MQAFEPFVRRRKRAAHLAGAANKTDNSANAHDQAERKWRLVKGPEEFGATVLIVRRNQCDEAGAPDGCPRLHATGRGLQPEKLDGLEHQQEITKRSLSSDGSIGARQLRRA